MALSVGTKDKRPCDYNMTLTLDGVQVFESGFHKNVVKSGLEERPMTSSGTGGTVDMLYSVTDDASVRVTRSMDGDTITVEVLRKSRDNAIITTPADTRDLLYYENISTDSPKMQEYYRSDDRRKYFPEAGV